jgi:glycosyltransferase involved in cell wall biosynthesis
MMDEGTRGEDLKRYASLYCLHLKQGGFSFSALFKLVSIIRKECPDVVQGWMYHANLIISLANILIRKPLFWSVRQSLESLDNEKPLTRAVIKFSRILSKFSPERIIYNSQTSLGQHEKIGFRPVSLVIPNGFDLVAFDVADKEKKYKARAILGLPLDAVVLGQVARFHPTKNHLGFIETVAVFFDAHPKLCVVMVGTDVQRDNPKLMGVLSNLTLDKAQGKYYLMGERKDLPTVYHAIDFLVNPSWGEAFPNVVGEAMACGVPCIVSDVGDSALIVGETGFVFKPGNLEQFRSVLSRALSLGPSQYQQSSQAARKRVEALYSISSIYDQYIDLYKEVVR